MSMTETGKGRHHLIQPMVGKCLLCARTMAKRTLGEMKMEAKRQASWCGSKYPQSGAVHRWVTTLWAPKTYVIQRIKYSSKHSAMCLREARAQDRENVHRAHSHEQRPLCARSAAVSHY